MKLSIISGLAALVLSVGLIVPAMAADQSSSPTPPPGWHYITVANDTWNQPPLGRCGDSKIIAHWLKVGNLCIEQAAGEDFSHAHPGTHLMLLPLPN